MPGDGSQPSKGKKNRKHRRNRVGEHRCGPAHKSKSLVKVKKK